MIIYTMGFAQKNAKRFFELIKKFNIELLIDIRLNNKSQLAGFTKGEDLEYFLNTICNCQYTHKIEFAPTKEILDDYRKGVISWEEYENRFIPLLKSRECINNFTEKFGKYNNVCLLCTEPTPEQCHRRLVAEEIAKANENTIIRHI